MNTSSTVSGPTAVPGRRLLLVHAHPDDETINNGATMARYVAQGAGVTLVTCTRGEQGEVIPAHLAHLADAAATGGAGGEVAHGSGDALGDHRVGELAAAMAALGVTDHRFLGDLSSGDPNSSGGAVSFGGATGSGANGSLGGSGAVGRTASVVVAEGGRVFRDSGMAYDRAGGVVPSLDPPAGAFALTDVEVGAELLAAVIRELRPQVLVSYDPGGGYGHPDHVQAHLVTMRAYELAILDGEPVDGDAVPGWRVPKLYWVALPESLARAALAAMAAADGPAYRGPDPAGRLPSLVVPDDQVSTAINATAWTPAKVAALRAHETQVSVSPDDAFFALSNGIRTPVLGLEYYRLVHGTLGAPHDDVGRETDLFAGT